MRMRFFGIFFLTMAKRCHIDPDDVGSSSAFFDGIFAPGDTEVTETSSAEEDSSDDDDTDCEERLWSFDKDAP